MARAIYIDDFEDTEDEDFDRCPEIECHSKIDDLPDEILQYVLSYVSPYKDLQECMTVCKRWYHNVKSVLQQLHNGLSRAVVDFSVEWEHLSPPELAPSITKRYSHSACCYDNSMFVFGGCTSSNTTFNDLWRLDLTTREWARPLAMGTYPSPKACATMVYFKHALYLFGGWTHPSPYPLHQAWRLFNEMHMYSIVSNQWTFINPRRTPPPMAGHSATVHHDKMVVFGGLHKQSSLGQHSSSNEIWVFPFESHCWYLAQTSSSKPDPRYGQSQIAVDDEHILIIGGCGGPNMVYRDIWLLTLCGTEWNWQQVRVNSPENGPAHLWCHPACKVGDKVVVFGRSLTSTAPILPYSSQWNTAAQLQRSRFLWVPPQPNRADSREEPPHIPERDPNVNGRHGAFRNQQSDPVRGEPEREEGQGPSGDQMPSVAFSIPTNRGPVRNTSHPSIRPNAMRNRQRQLEMLRKMEERILSLQRVPPAFPDLGGGPPPDPPPMRPRQTQHLIKNPMAMHVLDISTVLKLHEVTWLVPKTKAFWNGPEDTILYSLVKGKAELVMFGGVQKDPVTLTTADSQTNGNSCVSNTLHFISAPKGIV